MLEPPHASDAQDIAGWATSADEARWWGGHTVTWPVDPSIFCAWHEDPDVRPYVLREDGDLLAYGEVWVDDDEQEVELGRIIVRPERRGRGIGRLLVSLLLDQATQTGYRSIGDSPSSMCGCGGIWERRPLLNDGDGHGARSAVRPTCGGLLWS